MALDIQIVHHILKNTVVQNVNKPFVYITDLTSTLILIPFFIILNFLNKKESKVIWMEEFEIILLQTQSLSIKPFN
jgi:hypothetical protein